MARDEEYLLYPIDTGDDPVCLRCGSKMLLAGSEVRPENPTLLTRPLWPVGKVSQRRVLRVCAGGLFLSKRAPTKTASPLARLH